MVKLLILEDKREYFIVESFSCPLAGDEICKAPRAETRGRETIF